MLLVGKPNKALTQNTVSKQSEDTKHYRKKLESKIAEERYKDLPKSPLDTIEQGNNAGKLQSSLQKKNKELQWSDIPKADITPELAQDLKVLTLRNYIDPKHFYKTKSRSKLPTHFHVGTVVEGSQDFYSSRLSNRQRKSTFVDELLANKEMVSYAKRKSKEIIRSTLRKQLKKKTLSKTKFRASKKNKN